MNDLVIVTGHSRGIGHAVVRTVPWPGARIIGVSRSPGAADDLPEGVTLVPVGADLSTVRGCADVAGAIAQEIRASPPDRVLLVHAAATIEPMVFAADADPEAYERAVLLNSAAPQLLGRAFLDTTRQLVPDAARMLLFISTGRGGTYPGWSTYKAGKAALDAWVQQVGAEESHRPDGAVVLAVAPGVVDTAMQRRIREADPDDFPARDRFIELHERGELRDPTEVARELWRLLADPPRTGTVLDLRDR